MPADYLEMVKDRNEAKLLKLSGVVQVQTSDYGEPHAIVLSVQDQSDEEIDNLPKSVDHVPIRIKKI